MEKIYNVLIIEDHQIIVDVYKNALKSIEMNSPKKAFNVEQALDCNTAIKKLNNYLKLGNLDLVFLDINLPFSTGNKFVSGENIGIEIKKRSPKTKIIVCTSHTDNLRLTNILKNLNPEVFLVKNDINFNDVVLGINKILDNSTYYSKTIINLLRKMAISSLPVDDYDIYILNEIANGANMKELVSIVPLSRAAIEKRKRLLKSHFSIKNNSDRDLVLAAREKGFI